MATLLVRPFMDSQPPAQQQKQCATQANMHVPEPQQPAQATLAAALAQHASPSLAALAALQALAGSQGLGGPALLQQLLQATVGAQSQPLATPLTSPLDGLGSMPGGVQGPSPRVGAACDGPRSPQREDSGHSSGGTGRDEPGLLMDLRASGTAGVAGLKLPITCNEIKGVVYLDQQVVACYCAGCSARVSNGHDRSLFSFTRWERHCGSKAKKWRLSLRIDPGSVPECPHGDPPLPLGQWLELNGLVGLGPRGRYADDGDEIEAYQRHAAVGPMSGGGGGLGPLSFTGTVGPPARATGSPGVRAAGSGGGGSRKRGREDYVTPDLPGQADGDGWLLQQRTAFDGARDAPLPTKHASIFRLVYGLLEGQDRRAFNDSYVPWLNDLSAHRLECEFATLDSYLCLTKDMPPSTVRGLLQAYLTAILERVSTSKLA